MDDVVTATGAARASLYRTFGDKRALFVRALERYSSRLDARVDAALAGTPTARDALSSILHGSAVRLLDPGAPDGCLRCAATLELAGTDAAIDAALVAANRRYEAGMQRLVEAGLSRGELAADEACGLATYLTGGVDGMVVLARAGATAPELDAYVTRVLSAWPEA